jgi:DNA gyrase inhibitor GyrI
MPETPLNLTTESEIITLPPEPLVYIEKRGAFMTVAPLAWREFGPIARSAFDKNQITGIMGLGRVDKALGEAGNIYQAGLTLRSAPDTLPAGVQLRQLPGGKYARFLLTGSYAQLAAAMPRAFAILENKGISRRDEFCMERYLNDVAVTPEAELKTEILIPVM